MADRRHWMTGAGVGVAAAALLMTGLTDIALGSTFAGDPVGGPAGGPAGGPSARPVAVPAAGPGSAPVPAAGPVSGPVSVPVPVSGAETAGVPVPVPASSPAAVPAFASAAASAAAGYFPFMGAFTDSGAEGVQRIAALESWLGGTELRVGHTYLPGDSWGGIEGDPELLQPWADWKRADPDRLFVLNVPMQQHNEDHLGDGQVRSLIQRGASGAFDGHFTALARRLVELGVPDTVIVLGWEMNGTTYSHRCGPDPEGWKTYWNRVVAAMRAVPGQRFRFDFAPNRGQDAIGWTRCYPGDSTVDIIGMDSYDQPPGESFYDQVNEPYGLQAQVDFAALHGKAISYPEWGLFRKGDDPDYMALMLQWMNDHRPLYQTITDYCPHGVWSCTDNPQSSQVYRAMMSGRKPEPDPEPEPASPPTATPAPTATGAPPAPTATDPAAPVAVPVPVPTVQPTATPSAVPAAPPGAASVPVPAPGASPK